MGGVVEFISPYFKKVETHEVLNFSEIIFEKKYYLMPRDVSVLLHGSLDLIAELQSPSLESFFYQILYALPPMTSRARRARRFLSEHPPYN